MNWGCHANIKRIDEYTLQNTHTTLTDINFVFPHLTLEFVYF